MEHPVDEATSTGPGAPEERRGWVLAVVGTLVIVAAVVMALVVAEDAEDGTDVDTANSAVTTTGPDGATTPERGSGTADPDDPSGSSGSSSGSIPTTDVPLEVPEELRPAVWPWAGSSQRFDDPVAAARAFAVDLVGFTDPVLGELQEGDSRSGEVTVRPDPAGPVTTVLVRQLGDDGSWWVIGSIAEDVDVDEPAAMQAVDAPVRVSGRARGVGASIEVVVLVDGEVEPAGAAAIAVGGDGGTGPFVGDVQLVGPGGGWGAVVVLSRDPSAGRVREATVVRVGFIGGD